MKIMNTSDSSPDIQKQESLDNTSISRRKFLKLSSSAGAAFTLGIYLSGCDKQSEKVAEKVAPAPNNIADTKPFEPNAFIKIHADNTITLIIKHLDMGQGAFTGLSTLLAEELDADWALLKSEHAPNDPEKYAHIGWGGAQGTGGSAGLKDAYMQMRQAGATAKYMLKQAAANIWGVNANSITTRDSKAIHPNNGKTLSYAELAATASTLTLPAEDAIQLKAPEEFIYIGKKVGRMDHGKENGTAIYTQDIQLPGMLTAVVAHPPKFGATVKSFDASNALSLQGVKKVIQIPTGIAVIGENFWLAKKGRDALKIEWEYSSANTNSSDALMEQYKQQVNQPGGVAFTHGDVQQQLKASPNNIEFEFEFPYLAHATMEPLNCVTLVEDNMCEMWGGIQSQSSAQAYASGILGMDQKQIKIHTLFAGGSFGRRGSTTMDYVQESVHIAKAIKGTAVKLVWTREDDTRAGWFRPMYYQKIRAATNANAEITAWQQSIVGQSLLLNTPMASWGIQNDIDRTTVDGLDDLQYAIHSHHIETHNTNDYANVPVTWWRSVGHTHNAIVKEVTIDKLAKTAGMDGYTFRMKNLDPQSREAKVLKLAVEQSDWGKPMAKGKGRGVAVHKSFGSYVAQVAEVTVDEQGGYKVDHVVCAVDCGVPVNPSVIEAQMQGGIGFGLSTVVASEITVKDGAVEQSNFHDYQVLRMNQMPKIKVVITQSTEPPTGVGEPSTCVIGPAVINALADATGKYYTKFPLKTLA